MGDLALPRRSSTELGLGGLPTSDELLAKLVARGSTRAFGLLYRRHHQALYRYCRAIVRNEEDAQDALQNAMLRALQALQASERDLAVRPWLFRIAHNEAVSLLRRRGRDVRLQEHLRPPAESSESPGELRERIETLLEDLHALSERQRAALVMRELSGLANEEISAALSISPGAAKQAVFEARRALREFDQGRAMECEQVQRLISDGDRRVPRGRRIAGHLRACGSCREFRAAIATRGRALQALAPPLPTAAAAVILERVVAPAVGGGHVAGVAASRMAVAKPGFTVLGTKGLVGAAVVAVTAAGGAHLALTAGSHAHRHAPGAAPHVGKHSPRGGVGARAYPPSGGRPGTPAPSRHAGRGIGGVPPGSAAASRASLSTLSAPGLAGLGATGHRHAGGWGAPTGAHSHARHGAGAVGRREPQHVSHGGQGNRGTPAHQPRPSAKAPPPGRGSAAGPSRGQSTAPGALAGRSQGPRSRVEAATTAEDLASAP